MNIEQFIIEEYDVGKRLDIFLSDEIEELSRSAIQKLIENGGVLLNEKQSKANYKLRYKDILQVSIPVPKELSILPEDIELDILYEDKELIVVNKAKGMVVHPAPSHYSGTLVNALLHHCGSDLSGINGVLRPGIVHRIDKDTSGVLVVAKTNVAHNELSKQLAEHTMTRKYHAIVFNKIKDETGTINQSIARHPIDRKRMAVSEKNARHAITHYRVLNHLGKYTYIEAQLETGRTHQIRVHLSYIGHPLLGDAVYGSSKQNQKYNGQVLHAKVLGFIHPTTKEYMEFETPLPEYFQKIMQAL